MTTMLFILSLFFVFDPWNRVEHDSEIESQHSPVQVTLETERDEQSEEDCRYSDESIPHRDLSDYVVLEKISINANEEIDSAQPETTERTDSVQSEDVHQAPHQRARQHDKE